MVFCPIFLFCSASDITALISFMPEVTAENSIKFEFVLLAIILANVVLPTPGGPQKIKDDIL